MKQLILSANKAVQLYQKGLLFFLALFAPVALSSCMHMMMGGGHQGTSDHADVTQEKEVRVGKFKVTAVFPVMRVGLESLITVSIMNSETGLLSHTAEVVFNAGPHTSAASHTAMHMEHGENSIDTTRTSAEKESLQQLSQASEQGLFTFSYTPESEGEYILSVSIHAIDETCLDEPVVVQTKRKATHHDSSGTMGMMGSASTVGMVAIAAMAVMMLLTWMK